MISFDSDSMVHPKSLAGRLKLKHLELFREVCVQRSVRKAAEASNVTQPAATKLIQELEDMLGAPLFIRSRQGMRLTYAGEVMQRHVAMLLLDVRNMQEEILLLSKNIRGRIRIGVIPSLDPELLACSTAALLALQPQIQIELHEAGTTELLSGLANKRLDLTFGRVLELEAARKFHVVHVYDESFSIVCRAGHPALKPANASWSKLSEHQWILPASGSPLRHLIDSMFTRRRVQRPSATVECNAFGKMRFLISSTDMISILPRSLVAPDVASGMLGIIKPHIGAEFAPISLVLRKDEFEPPITRAFLNAVQSTARSRAPRRLSKSRREDSQMGG
jgi:DNA-binding transcriptional LysR family regulator